MPPNLAHDTLLGAYLLEPARRGFPFREICEERGLGADCADDAGRDAALLQALAAWQREQIAERGAADAAAPRSSCRSSACCARWRSPACAWTRSASPRSTPRVREEVRRSSARSGTLAGEEFAIGSPQQLGAILFEKLGLSRKRRGKTGFSTDARVLQAIRAEHEIIPKIERWRELNQLVKTYLDVLPQLADADSRIHTTFLQAVATTGRLASTNPNMQNVPVRTELGREIRGCFEAAAGQVLISADYSQVELRILAHVADEPVLKEIFIRGEDVHTATASQVFGQARPRTSRRWIARRPR